MKSANHKFIPHLSYQMLQYNKKEQWQFKISLIIITFLVTAVTAYLYYSMSIQQRMNKIYRLDAVDYVTNDIYDEQIRIQEQVSSFTSYIKQYLQRYPFVSIEGQRATTAYHNS